MDDVDRLFQCFKCGISPPESAVREKRRDRSRLKKENIRPENNGSPETAGRDKKVTPTTHLSSERPEKVTAKVNHRNGGKQISPVVFYGSPHGVPPKRPSSWLRLLREIRVDLAGRRKSNLRKQIWATFPKQDEAMKFLKEQTNVHIFSYQDHFSGQRRFLVSAYDEFWRRYRDMNPKYRHHYEVIQEGLPCHLYFDLEFNRKENAHKDGNQMVDLLLSVLFEALYEKYQIQGEVDWVVELDSSTEEKFSRHLVLRIPKVAFKDNLHAGAFVSEICQRVYSDDVRFQQLFISKDSSSSGSSLQLFVDSAVYSRNRCFRLALSSKAGKTSVLLPTGRFKCKDMCDEDVFMAALICNVDDDCEKLLVCKLDLDCIKTLHFNTEKTCVRRKPSTILQEFMSDAGRNDLSRTYHMGTSPFPTLDAFIEHVVASVGNVPGKIRCWYWFSEEALLVYSMSRNRYCERIGREHKSNHVMYVVDLQWALYYQKCYDPDCRGYRSPSRPLPDDIVRELPSPEHIGVTEGSSDNELENHQQNSVLFDDESMAEDSDDPWWVEAVKVADNTEKMGNLSFSIMDNSVEEDDEWWMEVERTASQVENCLG